MSRKLLIVFSVTLVAAQAAKPELGFGIPMPGLNRIVGGTEATRGEFPHQVSLQWGLPPLAPHSHFCGGIIIDSQWILTAGHCVRAIPSYGSFVVKAGKHELKSSESTEQSIAVVAKYVHESYVGGVAPYDIALLKLKSPLTMNSVVKVIELPEADSIPSGNSTLSGWGSISPSGIKLPSVLQKADLPIVDFKSCESAIESIVGPSPLHSTNVCTGPLTGGVSACNGDSGGPLIKKNDSGAFEIIGIVSWGITPCGTKGAPSVYTGVSFFVDWIQSTINKH